MARRVTAEDIRELLTSTVEDPTLVEWLDEDEEDVYMMEVVSGVHFSDISYTRYYQPYRIITTAADLRQQGDWDIENPTDEDFEAFAQMLNEAR